MTWKQPVSVRLALAFALTTAVLASAALFALSRVAASSRSRAVDAKAHVEDLMLAEQLRAKVERYFAGDLDPGSAPTDHSMDEILDRLERRARARSDSATVDSVRAATTKYRSALDGSDRHDLQTAIDALVAQERERLVTAYSDEHDQGHRVLLFSVGAIIAGTLGSLGLAVAFGRGIARLYRREQKATAAAERALQAHDEILRVVAHDLTTPLNAIGLRAQMLSSKSEDADTRTQAEAIRRTTTAMFQLVQSLRDAECIADGEFRVSSERCDPRDIVTDAVDLVSSVATARRIRLIPALDGLPKRLQGDRARLLQVFANILGNALDFASPGGTVRIDATSGEHDVLFRISDDGPGIRPHQLPHVFERYWTDPTVAVQRRRRGTGLGLYIARGIVEAHGGRIWAESMPGHGATFAFSLPHACERPNPGT